MSAYGDQLEDVGTNPGTGPHLDDLIAARLSRRAALTNGFR